MPKPKRSTIIIIAVILAVILLFAVSKLFFESGDQGEDSVEMESMNILILGTDARQGMTGRTDAIMLINYNPQKEDIYLLSIPRDTRIKIKNKYDRINAAYAYGGAELARESIEEFLDIEIDHHVVFNFDAFVSLVDMIGGIEVDVPIRMYHPDENINLQPGLQLLDGEDALAYSRFRYTSEGDIGRAKRQQEVVKLVIDKLFKVRNVLKIPQLIQAISENVEHDFSNTDLVKLASTANKAKEKPIISEVLPGKSEMLNATWYIIPDLSQVPTISEKFK